MFDLEPIDEQVKLAYDSDPVLRNAAVAALKEMGPSVIPELAHEVQRCYRMLEALKRIERDAKPNEKIETLFRKLHDEIARRSALIDPSRCPDCAHPLAAHIAAPDDTYSCRAIRVMPTNAAEDLAQCGCTWKRPQSHKAPKAAA
jgi:hypothetical protein